MKREAKAKQDLEEASYVHRINLAQGDWQTGEVVRARQVLEACNINKRHWEWHYLNRITHPELRTFEGHKNAVHHLAFSPDGGCLASAGADTVKVWDLATGQERLTLGVEGPFDQVWYSPDGSRLAAAGSDKTGKTWVVKRWELGNGKEVLNLQGQIEFPTRQDIWPSQIVYSPDGKRLARVGTRVAEVVSGGKVKLWDTDSGNELFDLPLKDIAVHHVAFSPDGQRLASANSDDSVKLWDARTGKALLNLDVNEYVDYVVFSPDGGRLVSANHERRVESIKLWDVKNGKELLHIKEENGRVVFSPDGNRLALAEGDTIKVWNSHTGKELVKLQLPDGRFKGLLFSPDGGRLAGIVNDKTLKVWDSLSGRELLNLQGHTHVVTCLIFSPDGNRLASAGLDKTTKLWDARTGKEIRFGIQGQPVGRFVFGPDGRHLASRGIMMGGGMNQVGMGMGGGVGIGMMGMGGPGMGMMGMSGGMGFMGGGGMTMGGNFAMQRQPVPFNQFLGGGLNNFLGGGPVLGRGSGITLWDAQSGKEVLEVLNLNAPQPVGGLVGFSYFEYSPDGRRLASSTDKTVQLWEIKSGKKLFGPYGPQQSGVSTWLQPGRSDPGNRVFGEN